MKRSISLRRTFYIICLLILVFSATACASTPTQAPAAQQQDPTQPVASEPDAGAPTQELVATATDTPQPSPIPPTPTPEPQPLSLTAQGFGQNRFNLGYGFILENPNPDLGIEGSRYTVTAYDSAENELESDDGYIGIVLPGQKVGLSGVIALDEETPVARIEVSLTQGKPVPLATTSPLTVENVTIFPPDERDQYDVPEVSGVVNNPNEFDLGYVNTSFIAYNEAGDIIGSGFRSLGLLPPKGSAGALARLYASGDVARVEAYAIAGSSKDMVTMAEVPQGAQPPVVEKQAQGPGQNGGYVYAMLVNNPNSAHRVLYHYQVTLYSEDGSVVGSAWEQIMLFPDSTTGVAMPVNIANISMDQIAREEILEAPVVFYDSTELPLITTSNISLEENFSFHIVTGILTNPTGEDLETVNVYAIAYNDAGEIIGGESDYLGDLPANGTEDVELTLITWDTPTRVELYAPYFVE